MAVESSAASVRFERQRVRAGDAIAYCLVLLTCSLKAMECDANTETKSKTTVYRCCDASEMLSVPVSDGDSVVDAYSCVKGAPSDWAPVVYSPGKQKFVVPGTVPDDWNFDRPSRPMCDEGRHLSYIRTHPNETTTIFLFDNGSLWNENYPVLVDPGSYCVDPAGGLICSDRGDGTRPSPKVRKCCGEAAAYNEPNGACVASERRWPLEGAYQSGFPACSEAGGFVIHGRLDGSYSLGENGELSGPDGRPLTRFCLELLDDPGDDDRPAIFTCPALAGHNQNKWKHHEDLRFTLYPMGLFLSVFFLAVTLIASCLLPSTYHVLHWRCQTNYVGCLLLGDLVLAVVQISGGALSPSVCVASAISMHFLFLAAFFWLNTMCFNIWWTFRDLRPTSLDKGQELCRLRVYHVYAWGGPLSIAGAAALIDTLPHHTHADIIRPKFGEQRCWFYGDAEIFTYFFAPIGILLFLNMTLFIATARELTCGLWKTEVVKSNTERATLGRVCIKLVVVMGITWVVDVLSWVVGGPHYLWYLTDLINALQGVMIFAVVGCQPQVWAAVKRLWCLQESPSEGNAVRSSSSHAMPSVGTDQNMSTTSKGVETLC